MRKYKSLKKAILYAKKYNNLNRRVFIEWKVTTRKETQEIYNAFTFSENKGFICIDLTIDGNRKNWIWRFPTMA